MSVLKNIEATCALSRLAKTIVNPSIIEKKAVPNNNIIVLLNCSKDDASEQISTANNVSTKYNMRSITRGVKKVAPSAFVEVIRGSVVGLLLERFVVTLLVAPLCISGDALGNSFS